MKETCARAGIEVVEVGEVFAAKNTRPLKNGDFVIGLWGEVMRECHATGKAVRYVTSGKIPDWLTHRFLPI
jgi:hypothetical protein